MAKPMKILELHYPMIQFLIITISTAVGTKNNNTVGSNMRAIFYIYFYHNFNPTLFSQILDQDLELNKN